MDKITTKIWTVDQQVDQFHPAIIEAAQHLKKGNIVAFPTETVYGLGANALDANAVNKLFTAKGRPGDNPLIVHIAQMDQLSLLVENIDKKSQRLMARFWPGPLTIIFKKKTGIAELVTAGLQTVAVRMPDHPVALALIKAADLPIAAPSANRSGKPSPTTAAHVKHDLEGRIDGIVDGGATGIGLESTVIDLTGNVPTVLRPGGVTLEALKEVLGEVELDPALTKESETPRSPGMKYLHYAPSGEMWIICGEEKQRIKAMNRLIQDQALQGKKVGVLTIEEHRERFPDADLVLAYGTAADLMPMAIHLYDALRTFDAEKIDYILAENLKETGIGLAIMNRLRKAAGQKIIDVDKLYS